MKTEELLIAYKTGKISTAELQKELFKSKNNYNKKSLSEGQKGLWMLQKMAPSMNAYNVPICFRMNKEINISLFREACNVLVKNNPILTSVIKEQDGIPYQEENTRKEILFKHEDISQFTSKEAMSYLRKLSKEPFSLGNGPLMRINVLSYSKNQHIVLIVIHHIIVDGSSSALLVDQLLEAYGKLLNNIEPRIISQDTNYSDFVNWEKNMMVGEEGQEQIKYWKNKLEGPLPTLEVPADRRRGTKQNFEGETYTKIITSRLSKAIKKFAVKQHVNVSIVFLAIMKLLLYKYTNEEDIIVGMPVLNRPNEQFDNLIGYFINLVSIRSQCDATKKFSKLIEELQVNVADAIDNGSYPFSALVRNLNIPRAQNSSPVFQTAFLYQNFMQGNEAKKIREQYQKEFNIEFIEDINQEGEYELALEVFEREEEFVLKLKYISDLFDKKTIEYMIDHYIKLAEDIIDNPDLELQQYSFLTKKEEETILWDFNKTLSEYPKDKCVHELFELQAKKTPDNIAIVYEGEALTYSELDKKSTELALYLQKKGVKPDSLIGICVRRSLNMVVGILGILKAGGAYVPLDPEYPLDRIEYMIKNSKAPVVITQSELKSKLLPIIGEDTTLIELDEDWNKIQAEAKENNSLKRLVKSSNIAYVIYTSGSTGNPKGVMIQHKALINFLFSMKDKPGMTQQDKILAVTTYCFDIAGLEIHLPLIVGAKCYICSTEKAKDVEKLKAEIKKIKPTFMQATPVTWTMLFYTGWRNEERIKILCGGEALSEELKKYFVETNSNAWNMFGPTETTIWSTLQKINKGEAITIGKPIANTQVYIVDENKNLAPIGVAGELCIAGDGLAKGYLHRPDITSEKFIENPYNSGSKLYKTGDLARWRSDGNIEFLGRSDFQVKIRGFRIELGDIESHLNSHPEIQNSVVVAKDFEGNKKLVAYYVRDKNSDEILKSDELRKYLKVNLPVYMIPSIFVELDKIPLTPNGKINRKELMNRKQTIPQSSSTKVARPKSEVENKILEIWKDVLKHDDIEIEDGFFDVGGDSLTAVVAADKIKKEFNCDFDVTDLFKFSNIKNICKYIQENSKVEKAENLQIQNVESISEEEAIGTSNDYPDYYKDSVAIIGMSCNFPGAKNIFEFWNNLKQGKECSKFFSEEEIKNLNLPREIVDSSNYVPAELTVEDKEMFDPSFFNISPKDAGYMDPQFRLLLMNSWKAVEDAGYVPKDIPDTSVFMSASNSFYHVFLPDFSMQIPRIIKNSNEYVSWLLSQNGTIPTMISHKMGFKGSSFFVHSNCSSSLVGMHSAIQSLRLGECKYALVGGATIFPTANAGYMYEAGLNFSSDGHCKAFDKSADGMVAGEGAAVIVLKRAIDAISDGDHIYSIIRGVGLNNDGSDKVGFYAPSIKGQAEVIQKVLDDTKINPESINYVETHGTGTKLGDPIEFSALDEVYRKYTTNKNFCGLGSVKTNIGHLDTASGLAGCIKVALSLSNNQIPPSINFKEINPSIKIENSPFFIVDKLIELPDSKVPHRAALSSFGIGGTNAHVILEQYSVNKSVKRKNINEAVIVPISAKKDENLKEYVNELYNFITEDTDLIDLAYTLQVGREPMSHRLAFVVDSIHELKEKLKMFIDNKQGGFISEKDSFKNSIDLFEKDDDTAELINKWIEKGKINKLAELWVKGFDFDWRLLNTSNKGKRISIPTYQFSKEYYGIPLEKKIKPNNNELVIKETKVLHPLLHENISDFSGIKFKSTFSLNNEIFAGYNADEKYILPQSIYVELIRAAIEEASPNETYGGIEFNNIEITQPMILKDTNNKINILLTKQKQNNGEICCEILQELDKEKVILGQGTARLVCDEKEASVNILKLADELNEVTIDADECYKKLNNIGIQYSNEYKLINKIYKGHERILINLSNQQLKYDSNSKKFIHPGVIESAIQAITVTMIDEKANLMFLPFKFNKIQILNNKLVPAWIVAAYSNNSENDEIKLTDIKVYDESGSLIIKINEIYLSSIRRKNKIINEVENSNKLMLEPYWREKAVEELSTDSTVSEQIIFLCEPDDLDENKVKSYFDKDINLVVLKDDESDIDQRFKNYAVKVFSKIKDILKNKPNGNVLMQIVTTVSDDKLMFAALSSLLNTARLENPQLIGQLIEIDNWSDVNYLTKIISENKNSHMDKCIKYCNNNRFVSEWRELKDDSIKPYIPWKDDGVYLITGGMGGLGYIFSNEINKKVKATKLVVTGRSPLDNRKKEKIKDMESKGLNVTYYQVDVNQYDEVCELIMSIKEKFGKLDGIIHAAGIINDNFILNKTVEEFEKVLAPKTKGLVNLDKATKRINLDFFILFSSIASGLGNPGQSDYSVANAFMDKYAVYRNELVSQNQRSGRTLAINWPLWKYGGMSVDIETEKMMMNNFGLKTMETSVGINALYEVFGCESSQVMVMVGDLPKIKKILSDSNLNKKEKIEQLDISYEDEELNIKTLHQLKSIFADIFKINEEKIDVDKSTEYYGIDSISIVQLNQKLDEVFENISKTLFYEYETLREIAKHLVKEHTKECLDWTGISNSVNKETRNNLENFDFEIKFPVLNNTKEKIKEDVVEDGLIDGKEPIAIIGVSGRYPKANTLDEYWNVLKSGENCITEIPKTHWDLEGFYEPNPEKAIREGKSYSKWGGFIDGSREFDSLFFNISPREIVNVDPQERVFVQSAWEVLEDAGYTRETLNEKYNGNVGVFVGITSTGFDLYGPELLSKGKLAYPHTSFSSVANRVSYIFNLHGPSMAIDTMCSSSLTAIHEACERIRHEECEMAIAGGVNIYTHPSSYIGLCAQNMISKNDKCSAFGEGGNGFVPGEGVGCVLLKKLSKAERDHDHIYGLVLSSNTNHGGKTSAYKVPNPNAQSNLIIENFKKAGIDPETISYVESAANGSDLGDAIEVTALKKAFSKYTKKNNFCSIGSVKPNIGHLEAASGISQLTKVILQLEHKQLAPTIFDGKYNSNLSFKNSPFYLQEKLENWDRPILNINGVDKELPRRAAISSFGAGGSNAHLIVEEYVAPKIDEQTNDISNNKTYIAVFSAKKTERLKENVKKILDFIRKNENLSLRDIIYTLQFGREAMQSRLSLVVNNKEELIRGLSDYLEYDKDSYVDKKFPIPTFIGEISDDIFEASKLVIEENESDATKIADNWVRGANVSWKSLCKDENWTKVSLPTYSFEKHEYNIKIDNGYKKKGDTNIDEVALSINSENDIEVEVTTKGSLIKNELNVIIDQYFTGKISSSDIKDRLKKIISISPNKTEEQKYINYLEDIVKKLDKNNINASVEEILLYIQKYPELKLRVFLKENMCNLLNLRYEDVRMNDSLSDYGMDSVVFMELYHNLKKYFDFLDVITLKEVYTLQGIYNAIKQQVSDEDIENIDFSNNEDKYINDFTPNVVKNKKVIRKLISLDSINEQRQWALDRLTDIDFEELKKRHLLKNQIQLPKFETIDLKIDDRNCIWMFFKIKVFGEKAIEDLVNLQEFLKENINLDKVPIMYISHYGPHFLLGGDRLFFAETNINEEEKHRFVEWVERFKLIFDPKRPDNYPLSVAVCAGTAQGGGFEYLISCDFQFVLPQAKIGVPEVKSNLYAGMGGVSYLSSQIGIARAKLLNLTGELIYAQEGYEMGLITHLSNNPFYDAYFFLDSIPNIKIAKHLNHRLNEQYNDVRVRDLDDWIEITQENIKEGYEHIKDDYRMFNNDKKL